MVSLLVILFLGTLCTQVLAQTPAQLASRVANQIFNNSNHFLHWDYGGAIIVEGLYDFVDLFGLQLTTALNDLLDSFITDPTQNAYKLLHNIPIPLGGAVGDTVGLFPIAYLARVAYYNKHPNSGYDNKTDLEIASIVAEQYLDHWPLTLPDRTFTRSSGWSGQPGKSFLWADDQFMGMTVLARMAQILNSAHYADRVGTMQLTYAIRELDTTDDVYWHGFNADTNLHSCCKWGRANGWIMMSHVEVLKALQAAFPNHPTLPAVISLFQQHTFGLSQYQAAMDGRWHQVIDTKTTYLETSCTAMFLWSIINGVQHGWLNRTQYTPVITAAWKGLVSTIQNDGVVNGICEGTGIGTNVQFYEARSTDYTLSSPGLGSVLRAISAYQRYTSTN